MENERDFTNHRMLQMKSDVKNEQHTTQFSNNSQTLCPKSTILGTIEV